MMKGEEPINKEQITEEDHAKIEMSKKGGGGKRVTQNFINDMKRIRNGEKLIVEEVVDIRKSVNRAIMSVWTNETKKE